MGFSAEKKVIVIPGAKGFYTMRYVDLHFIYLRCFRSRVFLSHDIMKEAGYFLLTVSVFVFFSCVVSGEDEYRDWTSASGSKVNAKLRSHEGTRVELFTKDGRLIRLELNQLSQADRDYLAGSGSSGGKILSKEAQKGTWYEFSLPGKSKFICEYELPAESTFKISIPAKGKQTQTVGFDFEKPDELYEGGKEHKKAVSVALADGEFESLVSGRFARKYPVKRGQVEFVIENFTDVVTKAIVWTEE